MKRTLKFARTAMMTAVLAAVPAAAQDRSATGSADMGRTSPVEAQHEDEGFDMGWMGLIGLAGLVGLRRKPSVIHDTHHVQSDRTDRR